MRLLIAVLTVFLCVLAIHAALHWAFPLQCPSCDADGNFDPVKHAKRFQK